MHKINKFDFPLQDERVTRTVARTFAPEFNFYLDFPSPLLWTQPGSDALSLAEILETAEVTFDLWHQIPGSDIGESFLDLKDINNYLNHVKELSS